MVIILRLQKTIEPILIHINFLIRVCPTVLRREEQLCQAGLERTCAYSLKPIPALSRCAHCVCVHHLDNTTSAYLTHESRAVVAHLDNTHPSHKTHCIDNHQGTQ